MKDWGTQRVEINRCVRSVLVTSFIDLGRVAIHVYPGKVSFRGSLCKMPGAPGGLSADVVRQMFADIERIKGVKRVLTTFDNWFRNGANDWVRITDNKNNQGSEQQEKTVNKHYSREHRESPVVLEESPEADVEASAQR